jgi:hypothetical protein
MNAVVDLFVVDEEGDAAVAEAEGGEDGGAGGHYEGGELGRTQLFEENNMNDCIEKMIE